MKYSTWFYSLCLERKTAFICLLFLLSIHASSQTQIPIQSVYSAGTTTDAASNDIVKLYSSIGQPIVWQSTPPAPNAATTNAGFMQVVNYIIKDTQSPVLLPVGNPVLVKGGTNTLAVTVTDVGGTVKESTVTLNYRGIAGQNFSTTTMSKGTGSDFTKSIEVTWFDAMGLEYFFTASDVSGNAGRSPDNPTKYHRVYLKDPAVSLPSALLSFGNKVSNYRVLSLPYQLSDNRVSQIFTELGGSDPANYRIWQYNSGTWKEFPSDFTTLNRAEAFFMIIAQKFSNKNLVLGEQTAPENDRSELYVITLKPGWNLIGNPYTVPINWNDVKAFPLNTSIAIGDLKLYTGTASNNGYENASDVGAFQGGFVFLDGTVNKSITIPFKGQLASGGREGEENGDIGEDQWRIDLKIAMGELSNSLGGFGMHPEALIGKDRFDDHNPPHFDQFVEINFPHPEHSQKTFSRDVVPTRSEYVWNFNVNADSNEEAILNWNAMLGDSEEELFLYDEVNNRVINMRNEKSYSFTNSKSNGFKIYFGSEVFSKIKPSGLFIGSPYPNPVQAGSSFALDLALPDASSSYSITMDIVNAQGQKVGEHQTQMQAGRETSLIDLSQHEFAAGIYFYRLTVTSSTFRQIANGKLIIR